MIKIVLRIMISPQALRVIVGATTSVLALLSAKRYKDRKRSKPQEAEEEECPTNKTY